MYHTLTLALHISVNIQLYILVTSQSSLLDLNWPAPARQFDFLDPCFGFEGIFYLFKLRLRVNLSVIFEILAPRFDYFESSGR